MLRNKKIGMIGVGNMGAALVRGFTHAQIVPPKNIFISDLDEEKTKALADELKVNVCKNGEIVDKSEIVILAVKPQSMKETLCSIRSHFRSDQLVISIAAGLHSTTIEDYIGIAVPVVRIMPNLPVVVKAGASAYSLGQHASWPHGVVASLLFSSVGLILEVDEGQMDTVTALSGTGPAYVFLLAEIMAEAGKREGLPEEVSGYLSVQTIYGGALMMEQSQNSPAELRAQVTSPGGTTAAAIASLEDNDFRETFYKGVNAARKRSAELSQM